MKVFKAEDFVGNPSDSYFSPEDGLIAASIANKIFNEWLEKQVVVYACEVTAWSEVRLAGDTHKARLCVVEEIK